MITTAMPRVKSRAKIGVRVGVVSFESKKMPLPRARAFAKMLERNPRNPATAQIEKVGKADGKNPFFIVCWTPQAAERQQSLVDRYQAEQQARCDAEYSRWEFRGNADTLSYADVKTLDLDERTGEVKGTNEYRVTDATCSCPHFTGRLQYVGVLCKHICGWHRKKVEVRARQATEKNLPTDNRQSVSDNRTTGRSIK